MMDVGSATGASVCGDSEKTPAAGSACAKTVDDRALSASR